MLEQSLSPTSASFWATFFLAVIALAPLRSGPVRRYVFAGVNFLFLTLLLRGQVAVLIVGLAGTWGLLQLVTRPATRKFAAGAAGLLAAALFGLHKMPEVSASLSLGMVNPLLAVLGFSYVALRLVEVFRAAYEDEVCPGPVDLINYLLPFHMLAAGPIQSWREFRQQLDVPAPLDTEGVLNAIERIAFGLFKKFVLAYSIQRLFLTGFGGEGFWVNFLEMQFFFLWLFLDFSAYSDIAVGIGRLIGVATPENFNRPYLARNMIDFWDRWHISLSLWIRHNIFIPLQLALVRKTENRYQLVPATLAFTVAFVLCGLWHDISLPYLAWGAMHAVGLVVTNAYRYALTRKLGGRKGVAAYMQRPVIRVIATLLTYEYVAFSLLLIG